MEPAPRRLPHHSVEPQWHRLTRWTTWALAAEGFRVRVQPVTATGIGANGKAPLVGRRGRVLLDRKNGRGGDSFLSPTLQEEVPRDDRGPWLRGGRVISDLDVCGGTMDRPGLNMAIGRVRDGASGGIACRPRLTCLIGQDG